MKRARTSLWIIPVALALAAGARNTENTPNTTEIVVNSLEDIAAPPNGITVEWGGGEASHARVLAVYGDLTMKNMTVSSGYSQAEAITSGLRSSGRRISSRWRRLTSWGPPGPRGRWATSARSSGRARGALFDFVPSPLITLAQPDKGNPAWPRPARSVIQTIPRRPVFAATARRL